MTEQATGISVTSWSALARVSRLFRYNSSIKESENNFKLIKSDGIKDLKRLRIWGLQEEKKKYIASS